MRRLTQDEFIGRARQAHGDKYDYSESLYKSYEDNVIIICPIHGRFEQNAGMHLCGKGCPKCGLYKNKKNPKYNIRKKIQGVGINDYKYTPNDVDKTYLLSFNIWHKIIERCYSPKWYEKRPSYIDCNVCDEWLYYTNFKKWFEDPVNGYMKGYHLDKDILVKGNKVYSPETCCFVPCFINSIFTKRNRCRGDLPIGVYKKHDGKYHAECGSYGKSIGLGEYATQEEAFNAYKEFKERYIKEVAKEYYDKNLITERVYQAMLNYKVEITD